MADRVGQQFGNYHLVQFLGQNSFAEAYLGKDKYTDGQVFIKILAVRLAQQNLQTFLTEARTLADLSHPNIVRMLYSGVEGSENIPYLVMDYAAQGSLRKRYPQGVSLPLNEVVSYVKQSAAALQYAHSKGVIHSDIKPENMLVGPKGELQLSDFSIPVIEYILRAKGQNTGGTPYTAPEQLQGRPQPASDQYALGVVVYELLSGMNPATHGKFAGARPPLREKLQQLPEAVDMVVNTALAQDPQKRFGSIQVFAHALEQASISADGPTQASQPMPGLLSSDPYKLPVPPPPPSSMFNPNFAQAVENRQTPPPPPPMSQGNPQRYNFNAPLPPGVQPPAGQPAAQAGSQPPAGSSPSVPGQSPQPWQSPAQASGIQPPLQGQPQASGIQPPLRQAGQTPVVLPALGMEDATTTMQPAPEISKPDRVAREEIAPPVQRPTPVKREKQRSNFGYIAIIVVLLLILLGGGSAWAYTKFFQASPVTSPTPTSQASVQTPTPDLSATGTAYALATASAATPTVTGAITPTGTSILTPTVGVTATPTTSSGTQVYDKTVQNLTVPCISDCQTDNLLVVIVSVNESQTTLTWHMSVTNNGSAVCDLHTSMHLENVNTGTDATPDSGSFTTDNTTTLDVGQVLSSTAIFDNVTLNGATLYDVKTSASCGGNAGSGRIEQFNL